MTSTASHAENPATTGAGGQLGGAAFFATGWALACLGAGFGAGAGAEAGGDGAATGAARSEGAPGWLGAADAGPGARPPPIDAAATSPKYQPDLRLRPPLAEASLWISVTSMRPICSFLLVDGTRAGSVRGGALSPSARSHQRWRSPLGVQDLDVDSEAGEDAQEVGAEPSLRTFIDLTVATRDWDFTDL